MTDVRSVETNQTARISLQSCNNVKEHKRQKSNRLRQNHPAPPACLPLIYPLPNPTTYIVKPENQTNNASAPPVKRCLRPLNKTRKTVFERNATFFGSFCESRLDYQGLKGEFLSPRRPFTSHCGHGPPLPGANRRENRLSTDLPPDSAGRRLESDRRDSSAGDSPPPLPKQAHCHHADGSRKVDQRFRRPDLFLHHEMHRAEHHRHV